jgi:peptidoglycan glycosyltransferase
MVLDPFRRYNAIPLSKKNKRKWPPLRLTLIIVVLLILAFSFKTALLNNYDFLIGLKDWKEGHLALAQNEFNHVLARSPGNPYALDGLGLIAVKENKLAQAQQYYTTALQAGLKYNSRFSHLKTGRYFIRRGKYIQAQIELEHALQLQPDNARIEVALGTVARALGHVNEGIHDYQTALAKNPKNKKIKLLIEEARQEKDRGAIDYIFDSQGQPLAFQWLKNHKQGFPDDKEFAQLIGYDDTAKTDNHGSSGLEAIYRKYFPGNKLFLTVDARVQRVIFNALGWEKGAIIVMDPQTGAILGCLSQPTYLPENIHKDWTTYADDPNHPLLNRDFQALYQPGSIIKVITSTAALQSHLSLKSIFPFYCKGYTYIDGKVFYDWEKHGEVTSIQQAFNESCNMAYARLGLALGNDTLYEFFNRFGLTGIPSTMPFPVRHAQVPGLEMSRYQLAKAANGLGHFKITPLNAVMIAAAVANGGTLMSPYIVQKMTNINGKILFQNKPKVYRRVMSAQTAQLVTTLMANEVLHGIGRKAQVRGLSIAGKTGTAGNPNPAFDAWFICFAPVHNPQVAVAIVAEDGGTGENVAAPIGHKVMKGLMHVLHLNRAH